MTHDARRAAAAQVLVDDVAAPELSSDAAHHLLRVLRLRDGEQVSVIDGRGSWAIAELRDRRLAPVGSIEYAAVSTPTLTVAFAPPKGDRADWAVAKLTELGVDRVVALRTQRSVVRLSDARWERTRARWLRIAVEASMQSRRVRLPELCQPTTVPDFVTAGSSRLLQAHFDGRPVAEAAAELSEKPADVAILIGPEGGWVEAELLEPACRVRLGSTVLRTETAAVVGAVLARSAVDAQWA